MLIAESIAASLRFANSDLLVKLSKDTKLDILISSEVVRKSCPFLEPRLRHMSGFDKSVEMKIPGFPQPRRIYKLGLKYADHTLVLEGETFDGLFMDMICFPFDQSKLFPEEDWPEHFWKVDQGHQSCNRGASCQYLVIFKILHGLDFDFEDLEPWAGPGHSHFDRYLDLVSELCARAEYLGCLPQVAQAVSKKLDRVQKFWDLVAAHPQQLLPLTVKLRWKSFYFDALRHLFAGIFENDVQGNHEFLAEHVEMSIRDVNDTAKQQLVNQADKINELRTSLLMTELQSRIDFAPLRGTQHTLTPNQRNALQAEAYARQEWGDYLRRQGLGSLPYQAAHKRTNGVTAGPLSKIISDVQKHAHSHDPASLFGSNAAGHIADRCRLDQKSAQRIYYYLAQLVKSADQSIKFHLGDKTETRNGKTTTYRRARHDGGNAYFTYLPMDESKVPWVEELEWDSRSDPAANFDTTAATGAQLLAVGIVP